MKWRRPDYFDRFACIGSACGDTCCAGWEIEVDEECCSRYLRMEGTLGERLRGNLKIEREESYFVLKDGRCPFLNQNGLCDIILESGEENLCDICREHPRFYNWYGSWTEVGLGMCCEEAQRLMFSDSRPARFVITELEDCDDEEDPDDAQEEFVEQMMRAREAAFSIVQDRSLPLWRRLERLLVWGDRLQELTDADRLAEADELICSWPAQLRGDMPERAAFREPAAGLVKALLKIYTELEALDAGWPKRLAKAAEASEEILSGARAFAKAFPETEWEYEHLTVYFINRYFMEAVFDMDVVSKLRFAAAGLLVIRLLELESRKSSGAKAERRRDEIIRRYSKEIEYCPENVSALVELCWTAEALRTESLCAMLRAVFGGA